MKRMSRSGAALSVLALTVGGLMSLGAAPARADTVNAPPRRSLGGATAGVTNPLSAVRTSAGTWVSGNGYLKLFPSNATGNAAPLRTVSGPSNGVGSAYDVTTDASGRLYVANGNSIRVFAASASGDVAPQRVIAGPSTQLSLPTGVAVGPQGMIYVADYTANAILVFPAGATGNVAPVRVIQGVSTGLAQPLHLKVVGPRIWAANYSGDSVTAYPVSADGNVAPVVTLAGAATGLADVRGVALDTAGHIYVANTSRISLFDAQANGDVAPLRVLTGATTTLNVPFSVSVNSANQIFAANNGGNNYLTFNPLIAPLTAPGKVRALTVKGVPRAAKRTVVWKKVADDGGTAVRDQQVKVAKGGSVYLTRTVGKNATRTVFLRSKLRKGTNVVWVRARNSIGYGPWQKKRFTVRK